MAKWKLTRQKFGTEEFTLSEGEKITVGRGNSNKITLSSAVISRNHCVIHVQNNKVLITDLQSSNGVYVGTVKIPPNTPYEIDDSDIIGLGWTMGAPLVNINDSEKFVFKLIKEKRLSITSKLQYQSENEMDEIESQIAKLEGDIKRSIDIIDGYKSPMLTTKLSLKRKIDDKNLKNIVKEEPQSNEIDGNEVINILSDSDSENYVKPKDVGGKKPKLEPIHEEAPKSLLKDNEIKQESDFEFEAFNVKQEYLGYDEPIEITSDSDSESEQWLLRLSQSSPGKPFLKMAKSSLANLSQEDSSYSQLDDFVCVNNFEDNEEDFADDIISIPLQPPEENQKVANNNFLGTMDDKVPKVIDTESEEFYEDIISINKPASLSREDTNKDEVDGLGTDHLSKQTEKNNKNEASRLSTEYLEKHAENVNKSPANYIVKKAQMIQPKAHLTKGKSVRALIEGKSKSSKLNHKKRQSKTISSKREITNSQKEERKKKLKEIACRNKESDSKHSKNTSESKVTNKDSTTSTHEELLADVTLGVVRPVNRIEHTRKSKDNMEERVSTTKELKNKEVTEDVENKKKASEKSNKDKSKESKSKDRPEKKISNKTPEREKRVPLKSLKPLTDSKESFSGKPFSKVGPMQVEKPKKKVRFSETAPQVLEFEIEPGNKMKKTSLVKTTLVDARQAPVFSLEKITLMKILRWNPQWLEEQINNNDPPPILGHNNTPMTVFHSFTNHSQYVQLVGDLLLMEIWECLTIAYMKIRNHNIGLEMRIDTLPPIPSQERYLELFSLSVNISVPSSESRNVPRMGEILLVSFGPETAKNHRFFFVHNVRCIPTRSNNRLVNYNVSLQSAFTDKMMLLKPGDIMIGRTLAFINNELMLFEAMEYLAGSPLSEAILKPAPHHFIKPQLQNSFHLKSQWTATLNPSQIEAVSSSVAAALGDQPSIQMVQGPPGTGKSSVICAIVMTYFYDANGRKQQNRGKILICATSNAAVDGLVIRLLNLRQSLPKQERFRMVRVGRAEAMHPTAANVSSQQLAQRDLARIHHDQPAHTAGLHDEILHIEAKINMWKTAAHEAKDPVRVAYCQGRVNDLVKRIGLLRSGSGRPGGSGEDIRPEHVIQAERRIIEGADIIVTTLASAQNHKMRGLKRRIALCIIDEAGQVIEPETLIPLTLDVTRLTLIGDPQQLPGFICSQRAKQHGLNESLFSRLSSCTEQWPGGSPVILLNQQYRMHPDIVDYPSRAFYDGRIQTVSPIRPDLQIPAYNIISISSGDKGQGTSGANEMEAWGVSRLVIALDALLRPLNLKLAVITPYNAHKELIKKHLRTLQQSECQVEVNTVDSFQGQERDVVVVSLARSQGVGFLTDAGRMNVMLTRAKHALLICLNPHALLKNHQWRTLVEDAQKRNLYKVLPYKMCQPITPAQVSNDEILKYIINPKPANNSRR